LKKIDFGRYSALRPSVFSVLDGAAIVVKFEGAYRRGSHGNGDGLFMAALLAAHFVLLEPICFILDLRALSYEWGNTILKAINFFDEYGRDEDEKAQPVIIVATDATREALESLERIVKSGRRIYCDDLEIALSIAEREIQEYLSCVTNDPEKRTEGFQLKA